MKQYSLPIFQRILEQSQKQGMMPHKTAASLDWYRKKTTPVKLDLQNEKNAVERAKLPVQLGQIYIFEYHAKHAATLPYYDQYPLVLVLARTPGGFMGINFHYIHPKMRARLFEQLLKLERMDTIAHTEKIKVTYRILDSYAKFKYFRPCIKRYLVSQLGRVFIKTNSSEWEIALFLPTEKFIGTKKENVWEDSNEAIKRNSK